MQHLMHGVQIDVHMIVDATLVLMVIVICALLFRFMKALAVMRGEPKVISAIAETEQDYQDAIAAEQATIKRLKDELDRADARLALTNRKSSNFNWSTAVLKFFHPKREAEAESA